MTRERWIRQGEHSYPVRIRDGILETLGEVVRDSGAARCAIVTHPSLLELHGDMIEGALRAAGVKPLIVTIPEGEASKSIETLSSVWARLAGEPWERDLPIVAFGGGVVGDLAGFVAATLLRGLPLIQVPTSLLAMVDSSVGGKVAIDLSEGKNLVGAFKPPHAVLVDPMLLRTLPDVEWRAGLAEVVKHAILGSPELFDLLEVGSPDVPHVLDLAIAVKATIVEEDPFERGRRRLLNLGHTFGHAFERLSAYRLRHGEAVAMGLGCATRLARAKGLCGPAFEARLRALFERLDLPWSSPAASGNEVFAAMQSDKKRRHGLVRAILPRGIGDVIEWEGLTESDVTAALATG